MEKTLRKIIDFLSKLKFRNFSKAYFLFAITFLGLQGGGHAYYIGFRLLWIMAQMSVFIFPLTFFGFYLSAKFALWIKPGCGCRPDPNGPSDAEDIVRQSEEVLSLLVHPKQLAAVLKNFILSLPKNILAFLKS